MLNDNYWGVNKPPVSTKNTTPDPNFDPIQKRREAKERHSLQECKEFINDGRTAQDLLKRNPAKYYEYRESCVAHGLLAPKPEPPRPAEQQHYDERQLRLLAKYDHATLKAKLTQDQNRTETLGYIKAHDPVQYAEIMEACILRGLIDPSRLDGLRPTAKPANEQNQATSFELSSELRQRFRLPEGTRVTMSEFESMVRVANEAKAASADGADKSQS